MQKMRRVAFGLVLAGLFVGASAWSQHTGAAEVVSSPEAETAAIAYVSRTREVSSSDFSIEPMPDRDGMGVYRITLRSSLRGVLGVDQVFEVYVDKRRGVALGEGNVGGK